MIEILLKGYKSYSPFHIGILFAAPVFAAPFFFIFLLLLFFFFFLCNSLTERTPILHQQKYLASCLCHWQKQWTTHPGWRNPRSQLRNYVIFKTDSKEPKNKSEFCFLSADWSRSVFHTGFKVQFALLLSRKILQVVLQPKIKKKVTYRF